MNADKQYKVLKVKDHTDSYAVNVDRLFNCPFRILVCAKSGHGKSNLLTNILVNEQFGYTNLFEGDDIHIFSPTIKQDAKMSIIVNYYDIEEENLHTEYSDDLIMSIYETMIEDFEEDIRKKRRPSQKLFILDDLSSSGAFQNRNNAISVLFCNSRKFNVNLILLSQYYKSQIPSIRSNASVIFCFNTNLQSLEAIEADNNYLSNKKDFYKMFRDNVKTKFDFLCINYSNDYSQLYLDTNFEVIKTELN
jgi:hypothetical protein